MLSSVERGIEVLHRPMVTWIGPPRGSVINPMDLQVIMSGIPEGLITVDGEAISIVWLPGYCCPPSGYTVKIASLVAVVSDGANLISQLDPGVYDRITGEKVY